MDGVKKIIFLLVSTLFLSYITVIDKSSYFPRTCSSALENLPRNLLEIMVEWDLGDDRPKMFRQSYLGSRLARGPICIWLLRVSLNTRIAAVAGVAY